MSMKKEETGSMRRAGTLASLFAALAVSAAAAGETPAMLSCKENPAPADGPGATLKVFEKDHGLFRVEIGTTTDLYGAIRVPATLVLDGVECSQYLTVADHRTGAVHLEHLGCWQPGYGKESFKTRISVQFNADKEKYDIFQVTDLRPPRSPGGRETGFLPREKYEAVGKPGAGFSCTFAPVR